MNLLYIHQYFRTPDEGGCVRSYHLAKGLVDKGYKVTMITAHNTRSGIHNIEGIQVHYLPIPYQNNYGFFRRIVAFLQFVRRTKRLLETLNTSFDLAYVVTTPLTTGLIALHLKRRHNVPFYFEVGDLWPEAPIQMGVVKNPFLKNRLYAFEKKCYLEAQKVIALSPDIRNYIEKTSPQTKVFVVPNFSDIEHFNYHPRIQSINAGNPITVAYAGTFGEANHLENLIEVARLCQSDNVPVQFKLMGEGKTYERIKKESTGLKNIKIEKAGNLRDVKVLLEEASISYVSFKDVNVLGTGSPNKFFDGLAAGNAIVLNFSGWLKDVVLDSKIGFHHKPSSPEEFVVQIRELINEPKKLLALQQRSRALAEKYYSKDLQLQKLDNILIDEKNIELSDSEVCTLTA